MKVYLIRSQTQGVLTDKVFLRPPTEAELREVLGKSLVVAGHKNGVPVDRFVTYIEVETVGEPEDSGAPPPVIVDKLTPDESADILRGRFGEQSMGEVITGAGEIDFHGVGEVILIDDPRHPRYVKP